MQSSKCWRGISSWKKIIAPAPQKLRATAAKRWKTFTSDIKFYCHVMQLEQLLLLVSAFSLQILSSFHMKCSHSKEYDWKKLLFSNWRSAGCCTQLTNSTVEYDEKYYHPLRQQRQQCGMAAKINGKSSHEKFNHIRHVFLVFLFRLALGEKHISFQLRERRIAVEWKTGIQTFQIFFYLTLNEKKPEKKKIKYQVCVMSRNEDLFFNWFSHMRKLRLPHDEWRKSEICHAIYQFTFCSRPSTYQ